MKHSKVYNHPDRDLIIRKFQEGKSAGEIEKFLKEKFPGKNHDHLRVSRAALETFKKDYLVNGKLSKVLVEEQKKTVPQWAKQAAKAEMQNPSAYRDLIKGVIEEELNIRKELLEMMAVIKSRLEFFYDQLSGRDKMDERNEKILLEQMKMLLSLEERYDKHVNGFKEGGDLTINIGVVRDQGIMIREALRETLADVDPNLAIEFMERMNMKMRELEYTEQTGIIPTRV
jgi:hypothetical protein